MSKIDTSTIEGYEAMTAEEKLAALEGMELPAPDYSGYVPKNQFDNVASELSKLKKSSSATDKISQETIEALQEKVTQMEKTSKIAENKAQFIAMGYDEALAAETAEALIDGDSTKVFENQKKFLENHDKKFKADLLKGTSTPPAGSTGGGDKDFAKMAAEAQASGNMVAAAYYTRLAQSSTTE